MNVGLVFRQCSYEYHLLEQPVEITLFALSYNFSPMKDENETLRCCTYFFARLMFSLLRTESCLTTQHAAGTKNRTIFALLGMASTIGNFLLVFAHRVNYE